jgi:hypothetical protein
LVDAIDLPHQRVEHVLPGAAARVELERVARALRGMASGTGSGAPMLCVASCTSQARCSVHSTAKASGSVSPQESRPWLRRITAGRPAMLATTRGPSSARMVMPSKS